MKSIETLSDDFEKWTKKLTDNLIKAHDETADDVLDYLKMNVNWDTGEFCESIKRTPTMEIDGYLVTGIGSNMEVVSSSGKRYKLGQLLEHGTSPHLIEPVNSQYLVFEIDGKKIFTKRVNHPGTVAYNNYANAVQNNEEMHKQRISNAIKEAFKWEQIYKVY